MNLSEKPSRPITESRKKVFGGYTLEEANEGDPLSCPTTSELLPTDNAFLALVFPPSHWFCAAWDLSLSDSDVFDGSTNGIRLSQLSLSALGDGTLEHPDSNRGRDQRWDVINERDSLSVAVRTRTQRVDFPRDFRF